MNTFEDKLSEHQLPTLTPNDPQKFEGAFLSPANGTLEKLKGKSHFGRILEMGGGKECQGQLKKTKNTTHRSPFIPSWLPLILKKANPNCSHNCSNFRYSECKNNTPNPCNSLIQRYFSIELFFRLCQISKEIKFRFEDNKKIKLRVKSQ